MTKDKNKPNITQTVLGHVLIGNAGLTRSHIDDGYCMMLCTMGKGERFIDFALTKEQATNLRDALNKELPGE